MNPQFTEFYNLTYLYSKGYHKITINPLVIIKEKIIQQADICKTYVWGPAHFFLLYVEQWPTNPDSNLREKYFKCFKFNLTLVPGEINQVQKKNQITGWHKKYLEFDYEQAIVDVVDISKLCFISMVIYSRVIFSINQDFGSYRCLILETKTEKQTSSYSRLLV